jgi:hypothetical protein
MREFVKMIEHQNIPLCCCESTAIESTAIPKIGDIAPALVDVVIEMLHCNKNTAILAPRTHIATKYQVVTKVVCCGNPQLVVFLRT